MCLLEEPVVGASIVDPDVHGGGRDAEAAAADAGPGDGAGDAEPPEEPA
jgi:hypothetical protein